MHTYYSSQRKIVPSYIGVFVSTYQSLAMHNGKSQWNSTKIYFRHDRSLLVTKVYWNSVFDYLKLFKKHLVPIWAESPLFFLHNKNTSKNHYCRIMNVLDIFCNLDRIMVLVQKLINCYVSIRCHLFQFASANWNQFWLNLNF